MLGLFHILGTTNATKLKLSQESHLDKYSWKKLQRSSILADVSRNSTWPVKCA